MIRVGIGTDRHKLAFGKKLILGGIQVESPKGAVGHSDADALTHAVIDALLGASGLGDIGHHFPDTDMKWKGADSIELLKKTLEILTNAGYVPVNIDAAVHLESPKLGRLKQEMASKLAEVLKLAPHRVNVKAKTGEGLDAVGEGNAVEAIAIAQVEAVRSHTQILPKIE
jgi:2-C-methyl-D-erythritol 2,4-cyclodiphosphate synthase